MTTHDSSTIPPVDGSGPDGLQAGGGEAGRSRMMLGAVDRRLHCCQGMPSRRGAISRPHYRWVDLEYDCKPYDGLPARDRKVLQDEFATRAKYSRRPCESDQAL